MDLPIALRRARRNITAGIIKVEQQQHQQEDIAGLPPKTPGKRKRSVRFSEPNSSPCGLTPIMRRTSMTTPRSSSRRSSTPLPAPSSGCDSGIGLSGGSSSRRSRSRDILGAIRHTIDGRIERRQRRSGLRDMLNKIDLAKKRSAKTSQAEIDHLKTELKARDREIYELQNATIVIDTERIWNLEKQVANLQQELERKEEYAADETTRCFDWTLAARDPFANEYTNMALDDDEDDDDQDHFGDGTVAQLQVSTPSRARSSFPTPPATSPTIPATPCSQRHAISPPRHVEIQTSFVDLEKKQMEEEVVSLQLEVTKLATALESYRALQTRMTQRMPALLCTDNAVERDNPSAANTIAIKTLEDQVNHLLQSASNSTAALSDLSKTIASLGFPGNDTNGMITSISSGFRAARLELEYLTPGELTLPLTSHGAEVLDLLLSRLRELSTKAKEDESSIDEYHELEQSLRKQLDGRVTAMNDLQSELTRANKLMGEGTMRVKELEIGNDRFQGAIKSYVRDIAELEKLVEQMDQKATANQAQEATHQQDLAEKDTKIAQLDDKIAEAVKQTAQLLKEMSDLEDSHVKRVASLNKQHGGALALRDARVMELRVEIDRVNEALREAHETIRRLRVQNGNLQGKMEGDKQKAQQAMDAMKEELQRVLEMSQGLLDSPKRGRVQQGTKRAAEDEEPSRVGSLAPCVSNTKKVRRRPDSGLGLLDEDDVTF